MIKHVLCALLLALGMTGCAKKMDICYDKHGNVESCLKVFNDENSRR